MIWKTEDGKFRFEGILDERKFARYHPDVFRYAFDGFIEWRYITGYTEAFFENTKPGNQAVERIRGFLYDDADVVATDKHFHFFALGYRVVEPGPDVRVIGIDGYDILMDPAADKVTTTNTINDHSEWKNPLEVTRVASRDELIALLKDELDGLTDLVKIIADLLHHFECPSHERFEQAHKDLYDRNLKIVGEREPMIKLLFSLGDSGVDTVDVEAEDTQVV